MTYQIMEVLRYQYSTLLPRRLLGCRPPSTLPGAIANRRCVRNRGRLWKRKPELPIDVAARHRGPQRLQKHMAGHGVQVGLHRIRRLCKKLGLRCKQKRKFEAMTNSTQNLLVAPNLLERRFATVASDQESSVDLTYIATDEGWLHWWD